VVDSWKIEGGFGKDGRAGALEEIVEMEGCVGRVASSVPDPDPDPPDPHVFGPPGSGSTSQMYGSGSFYHHAKIVRKTLIPSIL
jgi:hypothetical protein